MEKIGRRLAEHKFLLRTGGAKGADQAFELGARMAGGAVEIFLPWPGYNGYGLRPEIYRGPLSIEAFQLAKDIHPAWAGLSSGVRKLHARNMHQILGADLNNPVRFVICWTPDGAETEAECSLETGGTGTAIRLASRHGIPVINLSRSKALDRIGGLLS
jgi:hypothetical protein